MVKHKNLFKKLFAFVLILVVLVSVFVIPSFAFELTEDARTIDVSVTAIDTYGEYYNTVIDATLPASQEYYYSAIIQNRNGSIVINNNSSSSYTQVLLPTPISYEQFYQIQFDINEFDVSKTLFSYDYSVEDVKRNSPYSSVCIGISVGDPDYYWPDNKFRCIIDYAYVDNGIQYSNSQLEIPLYDVNNNSTLLQDVSVWDLLYSANAFDTLPDNAVITSVSFDCTNPYSVSPSDNYILSFPIYFKAFSNSSTVLYFVNESIYMNPNSNEAYNSGYKVGYSNGVNFGLTQNVGGGFVDWLFEAGNGVLSFTLFEAYGVPITIGSLLSIVVGSMTLIWVLKVFAGG